jgi:putative DNA primase/helicase
MPQSQPDRTAYWESDSGSTRFVPPLLGREAEKVAHLRIGRDGGLWRYVDGVYLPDGDEWLADFVRDRLGDEFRANRLREVTAFCRANTSQRLPLEPSTEFINVANGRLYWKGTPQLEAHSPEVPALSQVQADWIPNASCPAIIEFLSTVFPTETADHVRFVMEWIGYCMLPMARFKKALMLLGPSDTGKSTLLALIGQFLGLHSVSHLTLQQIAENRFATAELYGRLANIAADLDARSLQATGMFKTITGGEDRVSAERKFGEHFSFKPLARLMFSANEAPGTVDQSDAYYSRWLMLPMTKKTPKTEQRIGLIDELTKPEEMSGLLWLALGGLKGLLDRGYFLETESMRHALSEYRRRTDTVVAFVDESCESCVLDPDAREKATGIYEGYKEWCSRSGRKSLGKENFIQRVQETFPQLEYRKRYAGYPTWFGLRIATLQDHSQEAEM